MLRLALGLLLFSTFAVSLPASAEIAGATVDGTWDCAGVDGAALGTVVIADKTYAFVKLDGRVGGYGKLIRVGYEEYHLPHYVVIDGYLKDEIGAIGIGMTGPRGNEHDLAGELFLELVISETNTPYCRRRVTPAS